MGELFTLAGLGTLVSLIMIQAVLGFDNLLYVSLESKRAPEDRQSYVRKMGIGLAIVLRIVLLFVLTQVISYFQNTLFEIDTSAISGSFTLHSLIVLLGGVFILYTSMKEVLHMMSLEIHDKEKKESTSVGKVIFSIIIMNLVFSFDSILSAMALTDVFVIMAIAIIIGGLLMIWLSDRVTTFLKKNRMYEVLGLFVLFIVGILLITEGGHLAELTLFGTAITPMNKTTFYFIIVILILVDIVQGRYQKKLNRLKQ